MSLTLKSVSDVKEFNYLILTERDSCITIDYNQEPIVMFESVGKNHIRVTSVNKLNDNEEVYLLSNNIGSKSVLYKFILTLFNHRLNIDDNNDKEDIATSWRDEIYEELL